MTDRVLAAIDKAERGETKLPPVVFALWGQSSPKVRILLNELCAGVRRYLEIGSWRGSTLVSAAWGNDLELALGVDNFSQFEGDEAKKVLPGVLELAPGARVMEADCLDPASAKGIEGCEVFFADGPHPEDQTRDGLIAWAPALADRFVLVLDDWRHAGVGRGYRAAVEALGWNVKDEIELTARCNGDKEQWWNGLLVAEVEK